MKLTFGYFLRTTFIVMLLSLQSVCFAQIVSVACTDGTVAPGQSVCPGTQPNALILTGNAGAVIKWQSSLVSDFSAPTDINITSSILTGDAIGTVTATTYFRAVVQSGTCSFAASGYATVAVKVVAPDPGSLSRFTLFTADGAVSNTGITTIQGDIGTNSGEITGFTAPSVISGTTQNANEATMQAMADVNALYATLYNMPATNSAHASVFGNGETLFGGVYAISIAASVEGNLTLDAQGDPDAVFIFRSLGAFSTVAGTTVTLTNGAVAANVFWVANGAIVMSAATDMKGILVANGAISMGAEGSLHGNMYSTGGTVSTYANTMNAALPVGGTLSGGQTICPYANTAVLTLTGYNGNIIKWQSSTTSDFSSNVSDITNTTATLTAPSITTSTWFRAVIYGSGCGQERYSGIVALIVNTTVWNGTAWSNGLPDALKLVVFEANAILTSDIVACNCHVTGNAQVSVTSGNTVTLTDALTIEPGATFTLQNNAGLIQVNDVPNSGIITLLRNSAPIVRLDHTLWSSPVTAASTLQQFSQNTLANRFYVYNTATNSYIVTPASGTFPIAKPIAIRAPNNWPTAEAAWEGSFTGVANNGNAAVPCSAEGAAYNGVGNPYPSAVSGGAFINANSTLISGTLYFYAHTLAMNAQGVFPQGTNYAVWNPGTGGTPATAGGGGTGTNPAIPNGTIQAGQGFLVHATQPGNLVFNNAMRVSNSENQFFRSNSNDQSGYDIERHRLWLTLANDAGPLNTILVGYAEGATNGNDYGYDGLAFGGNGSGLYSLLDDENYSVQGRAFPFAASDSVVLGFHAADAGTFSIAKFNADGLFAEGQDIYIKDNLAGTIHNITTVPYTFLSDAGIFNGRFELVYTDASLGTGHALHENSLTVYQKDKTLYINSGRNAIQEVKLFDLQGRLVLEEKNLDTLFFKANCTSFEQLLIVKVTDSENKMVSKKVILF